LIPSRDNIPIVSWFVLRGRCRQCHAPFSVRYALIEALSGLLFVSVYLVDVAQAASLLRTIPAWAFLQMGYHLILVCLLLVATFIDFDLFQIPDEITVPGMVLGLALGTLVPSIRAEPLTTTSHLQGFWIGFVGFLVGGGVVWLVRIVGGKAYKGEVMGFGDVTLMAMVGSFLGWHIVLLSFFLAAFLGLVPALVKLIAFLAKMLGGVKLSRADREIPFGPYLSMAAVILMLAWPWLWPRWAKEYFNQLGMVFWYLGYSLGLDV
jgi:leader peptidase (prepilin peptidase) / N-methyltransferase